MPGREVGVSECRLLCLEDIPEAADTELEPGELGRVSRGRRAWGWAPKGGVALRGVIVSQGAGPVLVSDGARPRCFLKVSRLEAQLLLERYPECGNLLLRPSGDGTGALSVTTRQTLNGCACVTPEPGVGGVAGRG